jgi:hypothetical protein
MEVGAPARATARTVPARLASQRRRDAEGHMMALILAEEGRAGVEGRRQKAEARSQKRSHRCSLYFCLLTNVSESFWLLTIDSGPF